MWTFTEAKSQFSKVVNAAQTDRPQEVSRRGKPAVVVMAASEYQRLLSLASEPHKSFIEHLMDFPQGDLEIERVHIPMRDVEF